MLGFLILFLVMAGGWVFFLSAFDIADIRQNWEKYRCSPFLIPFASFFGYNTQENFRFCADSIFSSTAGPLLSPFITILGTFIGILSTIITSVNSIRLEFATMMGGINTIFQNFADRMNQLALRIRMTATRIMFLMKRIFATMYAMIFMAMSSVTALTNFSNTILFKFLDTFCFDPDTLITVEGKGTIPIRDVKIGDVLTQTKSRVTSTFQFFADGQPMVDLPGNIRVSTNHYVKIGSAWKRSDEHPDAIPAPLWNGGTERPLICLNTNNHLLPVGNYVFLDYDETEEAEGETMKWVQESLNGRKPSQTKTTSYTTAFSPNILVAIGSSMYLPASSIQLGQQVQGGHVISIIYKEVCEVCILPTGERVTPGQLLWNSKRNEWVRAIDLYPIRPLFQPENFISFILSPSANIETGKGSVFRDYFEVHSPDTEQFFSKVIESH